MNSITPAAEKQDTVKEDDQTKMRLAKTKFVRWMLGDAIDPNSPLIPPDKWVKDSVFDFALKNRNFHRNTGRIAGYGGGTLAVLALGAGVALSVTGLAPLVTALTITAVFAGYFGKKTYDNVQRFKTETIPAFKKDMGVKYLALKMEEMKAAWAQKREELEQKKAAEKAAKAAGPKIETPAATPAPATTPATGVPKAEEKPANIGGAVGGWLLKKALEQAAKKKDPAQNNDAPKTEIKKEGPPPPKVA